MTNVVHLPKTILGNESYSVSLWVKADRLNNWTSIIMAKLQHRICQSDPLWMAETFYVPYQRYQAGREWWMV